MYFTNVAHQLVMAYREWIELGMKSCEDEQV